jgi:2,3-bisphosphoglycerate-independent phosphoglycerate mutase
MKYVVLIGDGMADRPLAELGGKTPLEAALTPNMDKLAREGIPGAISTLPEGLPTGSDVANLAILGYDPQVYYTGRAPFEAISMGIELKPGDIAFRCNLVTLTFDRDKTKAYMEDHSAGQLETETGHELIKLLNKELATNKIKFYPGVSYRNVMIWSGGPASELGKADLDCTPPHDILGKGIGDYLPEGPGEDVIRDLMRASQDILERHPINRERAKKGKRPANSIWLWGQGKKPELPPFREIYGLDGGMISAVDLTKGLGAAAGLKVIDVPGATGYLNTNWTGKAEYALRALESGLDFIYVHLEAPDEAGHEGNLKEKIEAIERFDNLVVGAVLRGIEEFGEYRILVMPDHATPLEVRTHTRDIIPFAVYDGTPRHRGAANGYNEKISGLAGVLRIEKGHTLMGRFLKGELG